MSTYRSIADSASSHKKPFLPTFTMSSTAIIGATGRYHCRTLRRFIRAFISEESGDANNDRWPKALGPNSSLHAKTCEKGHWMVIMGFPMLLHVSRGVWTEKNIIIQYLLVILLPVSYRPCVSELVWVESFAGVPLSTDPIQTI